jgi:hypothetical protein
MVEDDLDIDSEGRTKVVESDRNSLSVVVDAGSDHRGNIPLHLGRKNEETTVDTMNEYRSNAHEHKVYNLWPIGNTGKYHRILRAGDRSDIAIV